MKKYEFLEHTADIAIKAWGDTLEEVFKNTALAMTNVISDTKRIEKKEVRRIKAKGEDKEELLVDWLGELLYIFDVDKLLFTKFNLKIKKGQKKWSLKGKGFGERFDPSKHPSGTNVKGVSYNWLKIWEEKSKNYVRVILDV